MSTHITKIRCHKMNRLYLPLSTAHNLQLYCLSYLPIQIAPYQQSFLVFQQVNEQYKSC